MSKMIHTPGRWVVMGPTEHAGLYYVVVYTPDGELWKQFHIGNNEDAGANAHLIAAAPDMLAALEAVPIIRHGKSAVEFVTFEKFKLWAEAAMARRKAS